eukprot:jgi/Botrbrau1/13786/Bobra.0056s0037.1
MLWPTARRQLTRSEIWQQASFYHLHSLDLSSGQDRYPPLEIKGAATLVGETVEFKPTFQLQRPGLAFSAGHVIVAFGSHCDFFDYAGWVFAINAPQRRITKIWRSVKRSGSDGAGVWGTGTAPMVDGDGFVYVATGNGLNEPFNNYYGNSIVKLAPVLDTTWTCSNSTAWFVADYFAPADNDQQNDVDLGTGMPTLFTVGRRQLLALGGKAGNAWIQDTAEMGRLSTRTYQVIRDVGYILSSFLYDPIYRRLWINPWSWEKPLQAFQLGSNSYFNETPIATGPNQSSQGGTPTLSHNNGRNAILWTTGDYGIRAYDPSKQGSIMPIFSHVPDALSIKFQNVVVANGYVYLAGDGGITIYGLI